jgi:hypothetical protein
MDEVETKMLLLLKAAGEFGEDTPEDEVACGLRISMDELARSKEVWVKK